MILGAGETSYRPDMAHRRELRRTRMGRLGASSTRASIMSGPRRAAAARAPITGRLPTGPATASGGGCQRPSTFDSLAFARTVHGRPQIAAPLHVQPEIGAVAEHAAEDKGGRRR